MARWDDLVWTVLDNVNDAGLRSLNPKRILIELKRTQVDIARRALALEGETTITTVATQVQYPVAAGIYKIAKIYTPDAWTKEISVIHDANKWNEIVRDTSIDTNQPLYVRLWNKILRLWVAPPASGVVISLDTYKIPTTAPVLGGNPEIDEFWDDALEFGATASLIAKAILKKKIPEENAGDWNARYNAEILRKKVEGFKSMHDGVIKRESKTEALNF